jgi:hypothetical protein
MSVCISAGIGQGHVRGVEAPQPRPRGGMLRASDSDISVPAGARHPVAMAPLRSLGRTADALSDGQIPDSQGFAGRQSFEDCSGQVAAPGRALRAAQSQALREEPAQTFREEESQALGEEHSQVLVEEQSQAPGEDHSHVLVEEQSQTPGEEPGRRMRGAQAGDVATVGAAAAASAAHEAKASAAHKALRLEQVWLPTRQVVANRSADTQTNTASQGRAAVSIRDPFVQESCAGEDCMQPRSLCRPGLIQVADGERENG